MDSVGTALDDIVKTVQDLSEKRDSASMVDYQNALKAIGFIAQNAREAARQKVGREKTGTAGKRSASKRDLPPLREEVSKMFPKVTQSSLTRLVNDLSSGGMSKQLYELYRHMGFDGINKPGTSYYRNLTENDGKQDNDKNFDRRKTKLAYVRSVFDRLKPYDLDANMVANYVGYVMTTKCCREPKNEFLEARNAVKRCVGLDIGDYEKVDDAVVAYQKGLFENSDRFRNKKSPPKEPADNEHSSYASTSESDVEEAQPPPKRPKKLR